MTSLIGDFRKAGAAAGAASTLGSLLPQKVSPKKLLASTIGAAQTFQAALPQLSAGGAGGPAALPRAQSDGAQDLEQEKLSLPPVNMGSTGTFVSDSDPSLANTSSEKGFMAASQPAPTAQTKWKMMANAAKQDMASTQPAEGERMPSHARRAMNLLMKANDEKAIEENVEKFAQKLVDTFGSLSAAFEELDQHGREEITRAQWDAALNARGWNTEEMCGLPAAKIFSLVCRASKKPTGALTLPAWKSFFQKYLNRTAAHLLTEERPIDEGVSNMLQKFQAPNAAGEAGKPALDTTSSDGIYGQRRGAFIMRPPEELAQLQEAQDTDSDDEDGPSRAGSNHDPHGANAGANAGTNAGANEGAERGGNAAHEGDRGGNGSAAGKGGVREAGEDNDATRRGGAGALSGDSAVGTASGGPSGHLAANSSKSHGDALFSDADRHWDHGLHGVSGDGKEGPDNGRSRFGDIDLDLLTAGSHSHLADPNPR